MDDSGSIDFFDEVYNKSFLSKLLSLRNQGLYTDVVVKAGPREIACHKVVLSAASPFFNAMFNSGLEESTSGVVQLRNTGPDTLETIMNYMYTSQVKVTVENVQNLVQVCDQFEFDGLKKACEKFMLKQVHPSNCIGLYKFSQLYSMSLLQDGARHTMLGMFKEVVNSREFMELPEEGLIEYLSDNNLGVPNEDPVFEAMVKWVVHKPEERGDTFERILQHCRLPFASSVFLCHVVSKEPMVKQSEKCMGILDEARTYHMLPECRNELASSRTVPRKGFLVQQRLVAVGGLTKGDKENRYCWYLRENSSTWELLAQLPRPNWKFYSACTMQAGILLTGGYHSNVKRDCWLFDTLDKKWKPLAPMHLARCKHRTVVHGEWVYALGGEDDVDRPLGSVERMSLKTRTWSESSPMPTPLSDPLAVNFGRNIFVFGGIEADDTTASVTMAFDCVWKEWQTKSEMPEPCRLGAAASVNDRIYIVGGYTRTCLSYTPSTDQWSILASPKDKHGNAPAVVWQGRILVGGGDVDTHQTTSVIEEYDPEKDHWSLWKTGMKEELSCHYLLNVDLGGL